MFWLWLLFLPPHSDAFNNQILRNTIVLDRERVPTYNLILRVQEQNNAANVRSHGCNLAWYNNNSVIVEYKHIYEAPSPC